MEAVTLRTQVRHLFAGTILVAHLEYEEAKVALLNRSATRQTLHTVETTLQTWAGVNNANGMAGALYLQGLAAYFQGQAVHALDRFIASMCLAAPSPLRNRRIWPIIQDILRHNGSSRLGYHLHEIQERAENHTGSFAYLDQITADRSAHMTDIFGRLHPMITREAQK